MASPRSSIVSEVGFHFCNLCVPALAGGMGAKLTLCARVHNLWICFECAGHIMTVIQTSAVFVENPYDEGPAA